MLTGSVTGKERKARDQAIADGTVDLVVGTHALFSDSTRFDRLGLVVIDEQHKCARSMLPVAVLTGTCLPGHPSRLGCWASAGELLLHRVVG